jgi:hypothetical protein
MPSSQGNAGFGESPSSARSPNGPRTRSPVSRLGASLLPLVLVSAASADTVNPGNIAVFQNGQPALADEVNGNFDELILQINDHATRLDDVEAGGVVLGDDSVSVDCGVDGPDALHDAINNANNAAGTLFVFATGACSEVAIFRRGVVIVGTDLSITADGNDPRADGYALQILASDVRLVAGQGSSFFQLNGNGEPNALVLKQDAQVLLIGVAVGGATDVQTQVSGYSTLAFLGSDTVGSQSDGARGIRMLQSRVPLLAASDFPASTLDLNSSGVAIEALHSSFLTLELSPGNTQLNVPNAAEIEFAHNSSGVFGPVAITTNDTFRIADNSSVTFDGNALYDSGTTATIRFDADQPTIAVSYDGTLIDIVDDDPGASDVATLAGDVSSCSTGGTAYDSAGASACP